MTFKFDFDAARKAEQEATMASTQQTEDTHPPLVATPLDENKLNTVPPRRWLYGYELMIGNVSVLGGPGGVGKSAFCIAVALSLASGRSLLSPDDEDLPQHRVHHRCPVWIYNLEDPADELLRRLRATMQHHGLTVADLGGRIFLDSGRDRELVVVRAVNGSVIAEPDIEAVTAEIRRNGIKLMIVDPFSYCHEVDENSNAQLKAVVKVWAQVASDADCCIWLVHHFRKGGQSGDGEAFRGAVTLQGAAR